MNRPKMINGIFLAVVTSIASMVHSDEVAVPQQDPPPNFALDIRPLLSDHCFACHGPDEHDRQADVRLDTAEGVLQLVDGEKWEESLIIERLRSDDPDMIMPPPSHHKPLDAQSKSLLEAWVQSGAPFEDHWAFIPPRKAEVPQLESGVDPIDQWLHQAIDKSGLKPNAPTDRFTLARRAAFDLTGLPATWTQVREFVTDDSPNAYEAYLDRLLQSPSYGEHMGRYWLDLVRYGDTHGLHLDNYREMWLYRDWVIQAFNENISFATFITEQLAGDLLPDSTREQKIASGFNRLNVTTSEGGSIYEEVFARNVIDRTDAFGTVFLGLTTGCAVCHDHKFDPITQKDYYSLSAFFNSLDGRALDGNSKDHPPSIKVPTEKQSKELEEIQSEISRLDQQMREPIEAVDQAQLVWQRSLQTPGSEQSIELTPLNANSKEGTQIELVENHVQLSEPTDTDVIEILFQLPPGSWRTLELQASTDKQHPRVGIYENGNAVLSEIKLAHKSGSHAWKELAITNGIADIQQDDNGFAIENAFDGKVDKTTGWAVAGHTEEGPRAAAFELAEAIEIADGAEDHEFRVRLHYQSLHKQHFLRDVSFRLNSARVSIPKSQMIRVNDVHVAGPFVIENPNPGYGRTFASEQENKFDPEATFKYREREYRWQHRGDILPALVNHLPYLKDRNSVSILHQRLESPKNQTIDLLIGSDDGHVVFLNGKKVGNHRGPREYEPLRDSYSLDLKKGVNHLYIRSVRHNGDSELAYALKSKYVEVPERLVNRLNRLADRDGNQPSDEETKTLRAFYRASYCDHPEWLALQDMRNGMLKLRDKVQKEIPTTLVWKETAEPRDAFLLKRGQYDDPGDKVQRATPGFLPPMDQSAPLDRLGLAQWLTRDDHPLTARVAVNRFWQQIFGSGLVKTSEDFGSQGSPPIQPELLDELAISFRESGWNVKSLMKRILMTQAYQRSAQASAESLSTDPNNRLLARGPRFRLDAEMLRDQMLAVSSLLVDQHGGPSVKPPQPAGLWAAVGYTNSDTATFVADEGDRVYRRSVYTFWKRTSAPAVMTTFDAPSRESCTARRERTNTPLQALLLLNEPQTLEASLKLAQTALLSGEDDTTRIVELFQKVVLRHPSSEEVETLASLATDLENFYSNHPDEAQALVGSTDSRAAAWMIVSNTLLNLDEVVTK